MIPKRIEVGNISNQLFILLTLDAIHGIDWELKKKEGSRDRFGGKMSIDIMSENEILLRYIDMKKQWDITSKISFTYKQDYIYIDGESIIEYKVYVSDDELVDKLEQNADEIVRAEVNMLVTGISQRIMKIMAEYQNILNVFPYMFNEVTCLNVNTNQVETICLSPHYDILTPSRKSNYDGTIRRLESRFMVFDDERNLCRAKAFNRYDLGSLYTLSATLIEEVKHTGEKTTWIPLPAIEQETNLALNKVFVLKDAENAESANVYMYLSTKGFFYKGEILTATLNLKDNLILYTGIDKSYAIGIVETGELAILCVSGDVKTAKKYNIEAVLNRTEVNNIESLQPFANLITALTDATICDGSQFKPLNEQKDKVGGATLGFDLGRLFEFVSENWKIILGIIVLLLFLI